MTTVSVAAPTASNMEKPSFAKIAAAGLKPSIMHPDTNAACSKTHTLDLNPLPQQDEISIITPLNDDEHTYPAPKPKRLVQLASQDSKEMPSVAQNGVHVQAQKAEVSSRRSDDPPSDNLLLPTAPDDIGTQISSESGSFKPPSLDGKSVASVTTFALDEKESLRPDDSASVKAVEDEELFSVPGSGLQGSRFGSDEGARAFRDQLREISSLEPIRRSAAAQMTGVAPKGVLYVPPPGSGVGTVPSALHTTAQNGASVDVPPDPKLLTALDSPRDRIWVLKLEQDIIDFVKDAKESSLNLPQCNSFYRMLAHKIADYYMLGHMVDDSSAAVRLYKTPNCRIPPPLTGIITPSTAASTPPPPAPLMKILRRGVDSADTAGSNGPSLPSKSTSENGESSNDDEKKAKPPATREEREARYEAARLRIMGSAKPSGSPEAPQDKQNSRSSSVNGKKHRKKARADSDDDFDSRSAYSNYYATTYNPEALSPGPFGFPEYSESSGNQLMPRPYGQAHQFSAPQHVSMQAAGNSAWHQPLYQPPDSSVGWPSNPPSSYDLSADFRAMSFQTQTPLQSPPTQNNFGFQYPQHHHGGSQQLWQHPQYQMSPGASQSTQPFSPGFPQGHEVPASSMRDSQPYAYGQLPSQAYPGRLPNKMEHPLPGSYKGKHFNPQSQAFVPGNANVNETRPFTPQAPPISNPYFASAFGPAGQLQRQPSAQAHPSATSSPHQPSPPAVHNRMQAQPMTHPLPQPVFPRQLSSHVPLPPKPGQAPLRSANQQYGLSSPDVAQRQQDQSVVAKWGTPASLPAKPPPSMESFDVSRLPQVPQPSLASAGGSAPGPFVEASPLLPTPQSATAAIVNGAGQGVKRS